MKRKKKSGWPVLNVPLVISASVSLDKNQEQLIDELLSRRICELVNLRVFRKEFARVISDKKRVFKKHPLRKKAD